MGEILRNAILVELDPPQVEQADLRIDGGKIADRGQSLAAQPDDLETDLQGKVVMPGLVACHTHLYSALARGMPPPARPPMTFEEILQSVWWRLDRALDLESVELSAAVGSMDALLCGVTTLFDHHASPSCIDGSLAAVRRGVDSLGLRAVLCYEVSDRNGPEGRDRGIYENDLFLAQGQTERVRGMVGAHASFTLAPETLRALGELAQKHGTGVHIHVAEDPFDERATRERWQSGVMERLQAAGILGPHTLLAHATHLAWEELSIAQQNGAWFIHNPRSNMNNGVGYAPASRFGPRSSLGTDGLGQDMLAEAQVAYLRSKDAGAPIDAMRLLAAGHKLATQFFGAPVGPLRPGALADLAVYDYRPPTPLISENLAGHLANGLGSGHVDSVMVDGSWRVWARQPLSTDADQLVSRARAAAEGLWQRMAALS